MNKNAYSTIDLSVCSSAQKGIKMKFSNLEAIRDWCKDKFQPKGNYLTEVPIATDESIGAVKPDGETIKIGEDGTISASQNADITPENIDSLWAKGYWSLSEDGTFNEKVPFRPGFARMWVSEANGTTDAYKAGKYLGMSGQIIVLNSGVSSGYIFQIFFNPATGDIAIRKNVVQNELTFTYDTPIQHVYEKNKVPSAIYNNGYWGIGIPGATSDGGANVFLRIAAQGGLIPYQQGGASALGTSSFPWKDIWGQGIHGNTGAFSGSVTAKKFIGTADNLSYFKCTSNVNVGLDDADCNAIGYVTGTEGIIGQHDGAYYRQAYSSNWVHEIYGDYRTGQLAVRGKNNGTWQLWRKILDSSNYSNYVPTKTGTGASGTWGINITGTATKATSDSDGNVIKNTYMKIANSIINNLNSTSTTAALSANMGHFIKDFCSLKHIKTLGGYAWEAAFSDEIYLGCGTFLTVINAYNSTSTTISEPKCISFNIWTANSNTSGTIKRVTIGASSTANVTTSDYYSTSYSDGTIKMTVKKGKLVEYNIFKICSGGSAI